MTVDSINDLSLISWSLENGIWDGRPISSAYQFANDAIPRIFQLAVPQDSTDVAAHRMAVYLAFQGASPEEQQEILKEARELGLTADGMIIQVGFGKSISKFWQKHKVAICVGVATAAVITAVAIATLTSGGVAAGVIAAASAAASSSDKHKPTPSKNGPGYAPPTDQISLPPPSSLFVGNTSQNIEYFHFPESYQYPESWQKSLPEIPAQLPAYNPSYVSDLYQRLYVDSLPKAIQLQPPVYNPTFNLDSIPPQPSINNICDLVSNPILPNIQLEPVFPTEPLKWISSNFIIPGTQNTKTHISWMNGICNSAEESKSNAMYLQRLAGGHTIHGIYNHSNTVFNDIPEAIMNHIFGISPFTAELLKIHWKAFHETNLNNPNLKLLHVCHSQGTIHAKNALNNLPQEIRDRIIIVAIAPAAVIPNRMCFRSYNYASDRDFIHKLDPGYAQPLEQGAIDDVLVPRLGIGLPDKEELIILPSHPEATGINHEFQSPTFEPSLKMRLADYEAHKGEYLPEEKGK